ncbi:hypothetical protein AB4Z48_04860 [Cupriavidus sp. 2TAF22]|uniref:hypothetical protein n=1 Tax=unclassified Cupriavidus TaxID=2640874 RepID=UPI003F926D15
MDTMTGSLLSLNALRQRTRCALRMPIAWLPGSLSEYFRHIATAAAILTQPALACSFDISFNSNFEHGADRLPASEVRRLAEWMIDEPATFENKQGFYIAVYEAPSVDVSHALARKRVSHLEQLLMTFGVPASMTTVEVHRYRPGKSAEPPDFAHINFMPGCPHPCCPGPQPIERAR